MMGCKAVAPLETSFNSEREIPSYVYRYHFLHACQKPRRQHLEQRCSVLTEDLHKSATRTAELENEVAVSRAEVVRISGALHARRSTDVVDAERAFGEELQRVQERAARETRTLRQEASGLRTLLEQTKSKLRTACGER